MILKRFIILFVLIFFSTLTSAQKLVHVPNVITNFNISYNQTENDNFVVFYGDLLTEEQAFEILDLLQDSYNYYSDTLNYNTTLISELEYKFIVIIDESWSVSPSPNTANPNVVVNFDSTVDGMWLAYNTSVTVNEILKSHEVAHLFQRVDNQENLPIGETSLQYQFEETHAQYLAYLTFPEVNADYLSRQTRSRESWLRQNEYFTYYLLFYMRDRLGSMAVNAFYTNMYRREHPFKAFGRIFNKTVATVNTHFGEYAQRTVNFDFSPRASWEAPRNTYERDGILEANYDPNTGWFDVPASSSMFSIAPEAYGFNTHEIDTYNSTSFNFQFEGTKQNDPLADYRYGFVAIENDSARYGPIYKGSDTNINFEYNKNERVFLIVAGTPSDYVYPDLNDPYNEIYDYPYRYKVDIATSCLTFLEPCDDQNVCTINDVIDANCECNGEINNTSSFSIPFVSVNPNLDGWETYNGQIFEIDAGKFLGLSWAGTTTNSAWYDPNGNLLSSNVTQYVPNFQASDAGIYTLVAFDALGCTSDSVKIEVRLACDQIGQTCDDGNPATFNDTYNLSCECEGQMGIILQLDVKLEGFMQNTGNMITELNQSNLIPNVQPFNTSPWFYNGSESINMMAPNIVDWMLVHLYDGSQNIIETKAVLLSDNGQVLGTDLEYDIQFLSNPVNTKYVSIHHKSHIAVTADIPSQSQIQIANINFTVNGTANGVNQTKSVFGSETLICGDYDGNGLINNLDYNLWNSNNSALNTYSTHDGDGNGIINNLDYNRWRLNRSKIGEPLIQY